MALLLTIDYAIMKQLEEMSRNNQDKNLLTDKIELVQTEYKKVKDALLEYQLRGQ